MTLPKMKFRVSSPKQSEELQKVLFKLGYAWSLGGAIVQHIFDAYYFAGDCDQPAAVTYSNSETWFNRHENTEYNTAEFIAKHIEGAKKPHHHKDLITQWADGQEVEWLPSAETGWIPCPEPMWEPSLYYRIKPQRTFPKSTLTRASLLKIVQDTPGDFMDSYVAMVDAAVKAYILDTEAKQKGLE